MLTSLSTLGKQHGEIRIARISRSVGDFDLRHVHKSYFHELGRSRSSARRKWAATSRKGVVMSDGKSDYAIVCAGQRMSQEG